MTALRRHSIIDPLLTERYCLDIASIRVAKIDELPLEPLPSWADGFVPLLRLPYVKET